MTRIDLTKGQCTALAAYLRGKVTSHACATYDDVELWVLAVRALDAAVNAMVSARASAIAEVPAHVGKRDER